MVYTPSVNFKILWAQFTSLNDSSAMIYTIFVYILLVWSLLLLSESFLPFLLSTSCTLFKLQPKKLLCIPTGTPHFLVKNNKSLCVKFYGYPHHQNRLGHMSKPPNESCETSGFFLTSSKSREKIKKFQCERLSKQSLYISIRAFFKIRILSCKIGYLASISTTSSPLQTKSSDHFKDLHKPRLLTKFHDDPTPSLKGVPKCKSVLYYSQCSSHSFASPGFQFKTCRS